MIRDECEVINILKPTVQ